MTDDQLEKAARWLCVQRSWNPNDLVSIDGYHGVVRERWRFVADEIKAHVQLHQAASIALGTPGDTVQIKREPLRIYPTPDDVAAARSHHGVPGWALQAAAQAWCQPETRAVGMDARLAIEFGKILVAERLRCERVVLGNMSEFAHNPGRSMFHDVCSKMLDEVKGKR